MKSQVHILFDEWVQRCWLHFAIAPPRVLKHRFNDGVGPGSVLVDCFEIGFDVVEDFQDEVGVAALFALTPSLSRGRGGLTFHFSLLTLRSPVPGHLPNLFSDFLNQFSTYILEIT